MSNTLGTPEDANNTLSVSQDQPTDLALLVAAIQGQIHSLTDPSHEAPSSERLRIIAELGAAAYHLAAAGNVLSNLVEESPALELPATDVAAVEVPKPAETTSQNDVISPVAIEVEPSATKPLDLSELNEREQSIAERIINTALTKELFRTSHVDLAGIEFKGETGPRTALTRITRKLIELGILTRSASGRKYSKGPKLLNYEIPQYEDIVHTTQDQLSLAGGTPAVVSTTPAVEFTEPEEPLDLGKLSEREQLMAERIIAAARTNESFQRAKVNLDGIEFVSDDALGEAFRQLTQKLVDRGILTRSPGGRKYSRGPKLLAGSAPASEQSVDGDTDDMPAASDENPVVVVDSPQEPTTPVEAVIPTETRLAIQVQDGFVIRRDDISRLEDIVNYLAKRPERVSIRTILQDLNGHSRMPKSEQQTLETHLGILVDAGVLTKYGKSYGYKTEHEAPSQEQNGDFEVTDFDQQILAVIASLTQDGDRFVSVGKIVRTHFGQHHVDDEVFHNSIQRLKLLADLNYVDQSMGGRLFGLGTEKLVETSAIASPFTVIEVSVPVQAEPEQEGETLSDAAEKVDKDVASDQPNAEVETNVSQPDLSDLSERDQAMAERILRVAALGEEFKRADIDFSGIEFSRPDVVASAFSGLTRKLVERGVLSKKGLRGPYVTYNRGPKFVAKNPELTPTAEERPKRVAAVAKKIAEPVARTWGATDEAEKAAANQQEQDRRREAGRRVSGLRFASIVVNGIQDLIDDSGDEVKLTDAVASLSDVFQVDRKEVRSWLGELVAEQHFHYDNRGGTRLIKIGTAPESQNSRKANEIKAKQDTSLWVDSDLEFAQFVFAQLLALRHVQQGIQPKHMVRDLELPPEHQESFRQTIRKMSDAGYLLYEKNANIARSPHSKKLKVSMVKLRNQELKDRLRQDPQSVLNEIRERIAADKAKQS